MLIVYVLCWDLQVSQELVVNKDQHIARLQDDAARMQDDAARMQDDAARMQEQLVTKEQQNQELQHELAIVRGINQSPTSEPELQVRD